MNEFLMIIIVPFGYADKVINAANEAGANGATIMRARGADSSKHGLFFKVEPEEELILIAASKDITEKVCARIHEEFDENGKRSGSIYVLPVSKVY